MFNNPIAISLSPNTEFDDVWQTIKTLFQPWLWKGGSEIKMVEKWFCSHFEVEDAVSFNSGRSAFYALLKAFDIKNGDEVIIQAFTCVAVADPIIWTGAKPVFADIDETLNIDYRSIEQKINDKTKVIIVQHTFGLPANLDMITKIARKHSILLIEDCAHSLGAEYKGKKLGTFGDAAFFSFGRDKVISSVFGGMAIINSNLKSQISNLRNIQGQLSYPSYFWILQQLFHPLVFAVILPLYNLFIGKFILFLLIKTKILSKPVYREELQGGKPRFFPLKYPNALASLLTKQLHKLERINKRRKEIANYYYENLKNKKILILPSKIEGSIYLRFNILIDNANALLEGAKRKKMILGNWYHKVIDPSGVDMRKIGYAVGSCPQAESAAAKSLNLPTYPRLKDTERERVVKFIKKYASD